MSQEHKQSIEGIHDGRKGRLHVVLHEDLTSTTIPDLRKGLIAILQEHELADWRFLYLDMRTAKLIDSTGMNWLFAEHARLKESNKQMVLRLSSPAIHRVVQFTGLDKVLTVKFRRRKQTR